MTAGRNEHDQKIGHRSGRRGAHFQLQGVLGFAGAERTYNDWPTGFIPGAKRSLRGHWQDMKARQLIDSAAFGPEVLRAIGQAFDEVWAEIAVTFGDDPAKVEAARLMLATTLLSIASEDSRDVDVLKKAAMQGMRLAYWK